MIDSSLAKIFQNGRLVGLCEVAETAGDPPLNEFEKEVLRIFKEYKQLQAEKKQLITLKKMCMAIVKYNELRPPDSSQFLVRRDMYLNIIKALEGGKKNGRL